MLIFKINIKNLINVKVIWITYDRKNMCIYKFNHFGLKKIDILIFCFGGNSYEIKP
ncbi:hypothetical protein EXN48_12160 [Clostridium botulinum]|uniref:Uncharacterized protein n=2 Tax=Clostridium botulinum TaxID=1491 RepID=A0A6B4NXC3_CLOBO|nr:hypothetical protein AGE29_19170 [Clostridium botulinum]AXG94168.1 hypothetical protein AGE31_00100 [Clostridium botulinum]NEZ85453.1 hypothetical protein [Clostridium botulinum]NEZ92543.1 hypothetical protein [Clostridium botulinum]NFB00549.1 hypothetical protein [Clostridium botulinum]